MRSLISCIVFTEFVSFLFGLCYNSFVLWISIHWVVTITFMGICIIVLWSIGWSILYTLFSDISVDVCCILSYSLLHCIPYPCLQRIDCILAYLTLMFSYKPTYINYARYRHRTRNDLSVCTWVTMHAYFVYTTHAWLLRTLMPAVHYSSLHHSGYNNSNWLFD